MTLSTPEINHHLNDEFKAMMNVYKQIVDAFGEDSSEQAELSDELELRAENVSDLAESLKVGVTEQISKSLETEPAADPLFQTYERRVAYLKKQGYDDEALIHLRDDLAISEATWRQLR